jgi:S-adenosylmethionine:tRNA ribosyltransferase-isomerase
MHPKDISIFDFTYSLPSERIAHYPLEERDQSKLLLYKDGEISESIYRNIADYLPADSLLVFNNTKVVEARLLFRKPSGAGIEIFCLEPHKKYSDISTAMLQKGSVTWMCLIGGASKWKHGQLLEKKIITGDTGIAIQAKYNEKIGDSFSIELSWQPSSLSFAEILHAAGQMPLPPYIKRETNEADKERYQTIYAKTDGSVAAPTAGLHFTPAIFESLTRKGIVSDFVTLHVGAGTFKPVKSSSMEGHEMHSEFIDVSMKAIETIINYSSKFITAVGTTSLRTIESLYWMGVKARLDPLTKLENLSVRQWDPYELDAENIPAREALEHLITCMKKENCERIITTTQLLIAPGYRFRIADALVTNFHQPQSTLLLLVAAFIGNNWKNVYDYALNNNFRFLSYGDGCLLWRH